MARVHSKGQNRTDTPQTVGKSFDAKGGGVGKHSGRSTKTVAPDQGAASKMPTKKLPSHASVPYAPGKEKHGIHKTC